MAYNMRNPGGEGLAPLGVATSDYMTREIELKSLGGDPHPFGARFGKYVYQLHSENKV